MPLKMFLTLLIGNVLSVLASFWRQDASIIIMFLTGCFFGRFSTLDHIEKENKLEN